MSALRATSTFWAGNVRLVHRGEIVSSADPIVRGRAGLFEEVAEPSVERATAAPGERRTVRIPQSKKKGR